MLSSPKPTRAGTRRKLRSSRNERGFVLLVVLSVLGLLALVVATFAHIARTHIKSAAVNVQSARAEALADAGVNLAILDVLAARESDRGNRRFTLNAVPVTCSLEQDAATLTIAVQDEAGKVDLNIGSEPLLRALVLGAGLPAGESAVDAILDFRDSDNDRRPSGAERDEYRAAGRSYGPKNGPFFVVEELASVLGLTQADADRLRPFITVYSGQPSIDPATAPSALVEILARGVEEGSGIAFRKSGDGGGPIFGRGPLPADLIAASVRRAVSVRSQARLPGGTVFVREAVVELGATRSAPYAIRRWNRGAFPIGGEAPAGTSFPPC